ncbi:MAG: hypothetical protein QXU32_04775 [Nitrososphaerales archaeon]
MRFLIRARMPVETGNAMVKNPKFLQEIEEYMRNIRAEAAYFFEMGGERTMAFIADMPDAHMMPSIAEPLFQKFNAKVELHPVMLLEDLKKALQK